MARYSGYGDVKVNIDLGFDNNGIFYLRDPIWEAAWKEVARDCPPAYGLYDRDTDWTQPPPPPPNIPIYEGWISTPSE